MNVFISKRFEKMFRDITGDWRAIFEDENDDINFIAIGTHSELYK